MESRVARWLALPMASPPIALSDLAVERERAVRSLLTEPLELVMGTAARSLA